MRMMYSVFKVLPIHDFDAPHVNFQYANADRDARLTTPLFVNIHSLETFTRNRTCNKNDYSNILASGLIHHGGSVAIIQYYGVLSMCVMIYYASA